MKAELQTLLDDQEIPVIIGYNYVIYSIRTVTPEKLVSMLREHRDAIMDQYRTLSHGEPLGILPEVAYARARSVVVPIEGGTMLNLLSDAIASVCPLGNEKLPYWS